MVFPGESELARLMRAHDWSSTPVGDPSTWPENLRIALGICLTSRFPMHVWWGRELTLFYNDAYISFLGPKHPGVLGRSGRAAWAEIWHQIEPMIERVFADGVASWSEDIPMFFARALPAEEVYVTFSFSPVFGAVGVVDGMFCACTETTEKIIGSRRIDTLRELGVKATVAHSLDGASHAAMNVLAKNPLDVPFASLYLLDGNLARRVHSIGLAEDRLPAVVAAGDDDRWGISAALRTHAPVDVAVSDLVGGPWNDPLRVAIALPLRIHEDVVGVVVAGASARRPLDAEYRTFFELVAGHISAALSDARAYEDERRRAEMLAELDRAKTAFFSNVSHEFRTPLTLMLAPLEELLLDCSADERQRLELVHRNALRLQKLVNALLDFSRIEAGRAHASFAPHDLAALTVDLASTFRSVVESAGLRFVVDCEPLPAQAWVDREMWEKIVFNLLSNAFKFTFEGEITVALRSDGDRVRLEVRDTGVGIAPDDLQRVFERFHRVDGQRARSHEGSGIGLALVRELAGMHGGEITATSELGRGSCFTVTIPVGPKASAGEPLEPTQAPASAWLAEARGWTATTEPSRTARTHSHVLFVDDNADMREYVTSLLASEWNVTTVADGNEALAIALREPPDLVLTDVMMPGLDGFGLLRRLREEPATRHVPVVMLSARAGEESRVEGLEAGADDYLIKPFTARELRARVRATLELSRARLSETRAIAANEAKDEFLAMLGHELRNPLVPILTSLQIMRETGQALPELLDMLEQQACHMTRLLDDLLDVSRIAHRKLELRREKVDLARVIDRAIELVGPQLPAGQLTCSVPAGLSLDADVARLAQVFSNLLTNAIKYTPLGTPIRISAARIGSTVRVTVRDRGPGIDPTLQAHIFEPFTQAPQGRDRRAGGLGLGLAIARSVVELHGGAITLDSGAEGTTFTVALPLADPPQIEAARRETTAPVAPKIRVLVVDDNLAAAKALQIGLGILGYEVAVAHDGSEALALAEQLAPEVALLDLGLPGMDGCELGAKLRHRCSATLIAVTGYGSDVDRGRTRDAGFAHHLLKPVDLLVLHRTIVSAAGGAVAPDPPT